MSPFPDIITEFDCIYCCAVFKNSDYVIADNVRLETGSLEQQLLLSYDATEIRGLVEKLVAVNPAKSQWRINNKVNYFVELVLLLEINMGGRGKPVCLMSLINNRERGGRGGTVGR